MQHFHLFRCATPSTESSLSIVFLLKVETFQLLFVELWIDLIQALASGNHYLFGFFKLPLSLQLFCLCSPLNKHIEFLTFQQFFELLSIQLKHNAFRSQSLDRMRSILLQKYVLLSEVARLTNSLADQRSTFFSLLVLNQQFDAHFSLYHEVDRLGHISFLVYHFF